MALHHATDVNRTAAKTDSVAAESKSPLVGMGGLAGHLHGLGASLCEHVSLRAELAATEFQQEKRAIAVLATWLVVFCALAATTLLFAGLAAVFLAWDSPARDQVVFAVLCVFLLLTGALGAWLARRLSRDQHPFRRTVEELRRDAALLRTLQP